MNAVEKIVYAEERVAGLQDSLQVVEDVLEKAEQVAVAGEKAGRCARRSLRVLVILGVVVVGVVVAKKLMDRRAAGLAPEPEVIDSSETDEEAVEEANSDEDPAVS